MTVDLPGGGRSMIRAAVQAVAIAAAFRRAGAGKTLRFPHSRPCLPAVAARVDTPEAALPLDTPAIGGAAGSGAVAAAARTTAAAASLQPYRRAVGQAVARPVHARSRRGRSRLDTVRASPHQGADRHRSVLPTTSATWPSQSARSPGSSLFGARARQVWFTVLRKVLAALMFTAIASLAALL